MSWRKGEQELPNSCRLPISMGSSLHSDNFKTPDCQSANTVLAPTSQLEVTTPTSTLSSDDAASADVDAIAIVQEFLQKEAIEILFDGSMRKGPDAPAIMTAADIEDRLNEEDIDGEWVIDELMMELRRSQIELPERVVKRAFRMVVRRRKFQRYKSVLRPLLHGSVSIDTGTADCEWLRLAEGVFETDPILTIACLKHFIWQVKRKSLRLNVEYHLMPVIYSSLQGTGKTTFVSTFLRPLRDLASASILLSDLVDPRSGDIFRYPVLVVDDAAPTDPNSVSVLNGTITGEYLRRRLLGTSRSVQYRQGSTLIGTSNRKVEDLIPDETGNRRFMALDFKNGKTESGGDATVWAIVAGIDYELLWKSVDVLGPAPIKPHRSLLAAAQAVHAPETRILNWARSLDTKSTDFCNIQMPKGVSSRDLWRLYTDQTEMEISEKKFSQLLRRIISHEGVPFERSVRLAKCTVWPVKSSAQQFNAA